MNEMNEIREGVLFKVSPNTLKEFGDLKDMYGFSNEEMIGLVLHSFLMMMLLVVSNKRSLYLFFDSDHTHISTISKHVYQPEEKEFLLPWCCYYMSRLEMNLLKKVQRISMLSSLSDVFSSAVIFCMEITIIQINKPESDLVSFPWTEKGSFKETGISLNVNNILRKRGMRVAFDSGGDHKIIENLKKENK